MSLRLLTAGLSLAVLLASSAAAAQTTNVPMSARFDRGCRRHWAEGACSYPRLALGLEGGLNSYNEGGPFSFESGTGSVTAAGPSWGLRIGVEFTRWFAVDAHYIGMYDRGTGIAAPRGNVGLLTNAGAAEARFTLPLRYVQPYLFTGVGIYNTSVTGSNLARSASPLTESTEPGIPIGLGLAFPITRAVSLGAEITYHRLFGESFADDEEIGGGDLFTGNVAMRFRL